MRRDGYSQCSRQAAAAAYDLSRRARGGGPGHVGNFDHHYGVPAATHVAGVGRQILRAGGAHDCFRPGRIAGVVADRDSGARVILVARGEARRSMAAAQAAGALRTGACLGPAPAARCRHGGGGDVVGGGCGLHPGRQDLYANHGRGRLDRRHRETTLDQPGTERRARLEDSPSHHAGHSGGDRRHRARRLR